MILVHHAAARCAYIQVTAEFPFGVTYSQVQAQSVSLSVSIKEWK